MANVAPLTAARQMLEEPITYKYAGFSSYYDQLRYGLKYLVKETGAKNAGAKSATAKKAPAKKPAARKSPAKKAAPARKRA